MEVTVDVGKNITTMLQQLAHQIGTTADKVFPWYVHQAYLEGVTTLALLGLSLLVLGVICAYTFSKTNFEEENKYVPVAVISGFALCIVAFGAAVETGESIRQILNPNYYAMQMMTRDIGRLVAK